VWQGSQSGFRDSSHPATAALKIPGPARKTKQKQKNQESKNKKAKQTQNKT
jgi:hypothetical protein